jgi:hypothetical protein
VRFAAAPAAALIVAALAGCGPFGDGGGGVADGAERTGEEEFLRSGDEVCRASQRQVAEVQRDLPTSREQSVRFARDLIAIFDDEVARLAALDPPQERQAAFDRYLESREEAIGLLADGLQAAQEDDPAGYADAQAEVAAGQVKRAELAREVGFEECSAGPLAPPERNAP